jgi:hypothetical protein
MYSSFFGFFFPLKEGEVLKDFENNSLLSTETLCKTMQGVVTLHINQEEEYRLSVLNHSESLCR